MAKEDPWMTKPGQRPKLSALRLTLRAMDGAPAHIKMREACIVAQKLGLDVEFEHNGATYVANYDGKITEEIPAREAGQSRQEIHDAVLGKKTE